VIHPSAFILDDLCACQPVVQKSSVPVEKRPRESDTAESKARQREREAADAVAQRERRAVARDESKMPSFYREGLAALHPLPREVRARQKDEAGLIERALREGVQVVSEEG
jgi:hypothetical protein